MEESDQVRALRDKWNEFSALFQKGMEVIRSEATLASYSYPP